MINSRQKCKGDSYVQYYLFQSLEDCSFGSIGFNNFSSSVLIVFVRVLSDTSIGWTFTSSRFLSM